MPGLVPSCVCWAGSGLVGLFKGLTWVAPRVTAGLEEYAAPIIEAIDPTGQLITTCMYRQATLKTQYYQVGCAHGRKLPGSCFSRAAATACVACSLGAGAAAHGARVVAPAHPPARPLLLPPQCVKDMARVGRPLAKTVLVDDTPLVSVALDVGAVPAPA